MASPSWLRVVSMPPKISSTSETRSSSWLSRSSSCSAWTSRRDEVVLGLAAAVGDQLVREAVEALERRLDARQLLADRDRQRQPQVGPPLRDLRPLALGDAEQDRDHARRVGLGELAHELAAPLARRRRRSARCRAPGSAGAISLIAPGAKAGLRRRRRRAWSSPSRLSSACDHQSANGPRRRRGGRARRRCPA